MSQRNAMNERNQNGGPKGNTRRSASSAKPVSKAASSVYVADPNAKPKKGLFGRKSQPAPAPKKSKPAASTATNTAAAPTAAETAKAKAERAERIRKGRASRAERKAQRDAEKNAEFEMRDALRSFKPNTREYVKWHRIWMIVILTGVGLAILMLVLQFGFQNNNSELFLAVGIGAWVCLTAAIFIDMRKVKPAKERAFLQSGRNKKKKQ